MNEALCSCTHARNQPVRGMGVHQAITQTSDLEQGRFAPREHGSNLETVRFSQLVSYYQPVLMTLHVPQVQDNPPTLKNHLARNVSCASERNPRLKCKTAMGAEGVLKKGTPGLRQPCLPGHLTQADRLGFPLRVRSVLI